MLANSLTKLQIQLCFISVASGHSFALIILAKSGITPRLSVNYELPCLWNIKLVADKNFLQQCRLATHLE
jgi:hypothetical protein